jgi:hypothetical protein
MLIIILIFVVLASVKFAEFYIRRVPRTFSQALARENEGKLKEHSRLTRVRREFSSKRIFPCPNNSKSGASLRYREDLDAVSRKGEDPHVESMQHYSSSS